jgi:glutathione peroxidase-family protein
MKYITIFILSIASISLFAQDTVRIYQEGFGKKAELTLLMNGGMRVLDTSNDLIFEMEGNVTKPIFGSIIKKSGRYTGFYIEPGATKVIVKKKGFPASVEVPGSQSHQVYQEVSHAKDAKSFLAAIKANINDSIALKEFNVKYKFNKINIEELKSVYAQISDVNKRFTPEVNAFINTYDIPKVTKGAEVYDFTGEDRNGNTFNTQDYRGQYVLIDFAATNCGPCWAGYPDMIEATSEYENLQVITYNRDFSVDLWKDFADERGIRIPWPVLWYGKDKTEVFKIYNVEGYPLMYLISPTGEVLDTWYGSRRGLLVNALKKHIE